METWDLKSLDVPVHGPEVLQSSQEARIVAIQLPAGEVLQEHQVHERAWVLVVDGEIEITADGAAQAGGAGLLAALEPNERNEVRATSDARLLMILAPWPGEGHPSRPGAPAR
jgi:quercetin dioxygenase-like cupin family protein